MVQSKVDLFDDIGCVLARANVDRLMLESAVRLHESMRRRIQSRQALKPQETLSRTARIAWRFHVAFLSALIRLESCELSPHRWCCGRPSLRVTCPALLMVRSTHPDPSNAS